MLYYFKNIKSNYQKLFSSFFLIIFVALTPISFSYAYITGVISKNSDGEVWNNRSYSPQLSADGLYVVFESRATNLIANDTNGYDDIFVLERSTNNITRVSVNTDGTQANNSSFNPAISADSRYIAYISLASNLVDGDNNGTEDVFVYDRMTHTTQRVSVHSNGSEAIGNVGHSGYMFYGVSISDDGRYITFGANADNLIDNDTNNMNDILVHDRQTGNTERVSIHSDGVSQANNHSYEGAISSDGNFVVFKTSADNLVDNDNNGAADIFRHNRTTKKTIRVSENALGEGGNESSSSSPQISANGRYVAFTSLATNLATNKTPPTRSIHLKDLKTGGITAFPRSYDGSQWVSLSGYFDMTSDARYFTFNSKSTTLLEKWPSKCAYPVPSDYTEDQYEQHDVECYSNPWRAENIYVYDRIKDKTTLITKDTNGDPIMEEKDSYSPSISADSHQIIFDSDYSLVSSDTNGQSDIYHAIHSGLEPVTVTAPVGDIFDEYPTYEWTQAPAAVAYNIVVPSVFDQLFPLDQVDCSSKEGICSVTPLVNVPFKAQEVYIKYHSTEGFISGRSNSLSFYKRYRAPVLQSPLGSINTVTPIFTWGAVPEATKYAIYMKDLDTGEMLINKALTENTYYVQPFPLNPSHTYSWRARAYIRGATYSGWEDFSISLPETPQPQSPVGVLSGSSVTLTWTQAKDTIKYRVLVQDVNTKETVINHVIGNVTSYTLKTPLDPTHQYRWKVRTQSPHGEYSDWLYFNFGQELPKTPVPGNPKGTLTDTSPTFSWAAAQGANKYRVLLQDIDTREVLFNKVVRYKQDYTTALTLNKEHSYRWKVRVQNFDGEYSEWMDFNY